MSDEIAKRDENQVPVGLAVTNDASKSIRMIRVDPTSGGVVTSISPNAGIADGRKVVASAGTRETLASSTTCRQVIITAETDNTGAVVVGGTTVVAALSTRRGTPLNPGDSLIVEIDNLNDINLDSIVSGDGVTFTYFT